ncbi:6-pyruvoyl trahydropterin synthase family protein [Pontibacter akesuensis]|uniref:6-carboxy-5,6,7,8-tetrahydropterin synthase n=1 Tax=Pontibacter akesuensis TaxID=388950 RepID=A0A1I7GFH7_9BACT|nr:6-carboxytetrahydropterin synthase [Pontibacter akesuensis]GHA57075.1 6-carboxytetrahydropterin synthase QueD [Pontibacter akesuensis]SFU47209.1 6-pyruvoyltetrahydropterin/6-carboxytetrahydropterin synthase [Pontibacter akesuensis]
MNIIRLTRLFTFEMAHALQGYDGPCSHIHGHSYRLEVTITGIPIQEKGHPKNGMVLDFGDLKKLVQETIVDEVDHALLLSQDSPAELISMLQQLQHKLVLTPYQPTCENMLLDFRTKLRNKLPENLSLHCLKLWETQSSFAEWYAADEVKLKN